MDVGKPEVIETRLHGLVTGSRLAIAGRPAPLRTTHQMTKECLLETRYQ